MQTRVIIVSLDEEKKNAYKRLAAERILKRAEMFASYMKVTYGRITIRDQKSRWGSCSSKGNLNFNWRLVLMPEEVLDYVIVHELAHLKQMNHSKEFWKEVEEVLPDYKERQRWLKVHGREYMLLR